MQPVTLATAIVILAWMVFVVVMLTRRRPQAAAGERPVRRDRRSMIGIALQMLAYALVWSPPRHGIERTLDVVQGWSYFLLSAAWLGVIAALMVAGVALARSAIDTLGKQWTLVATVASNHSLVTSGPYARVRHPIYTAMLLLLIGTGLAMTGWLRLAIAVAVFAIGTAQRVHLEEQLLAQSHASEFQAYRASVPAVVPRLL